MNYLCLGTLCPLFRSISIIIPLLSFHVRERKMKSAFRHKSRAREQSRGEKQINGVEQSREQGERERCGEESNKRERPSYSLTPSPPPPP
jgi:hypothetical protein